MAAVKAVKAPITTPDISDVQDDTIGDWEAFDTETFSTERLKQRLEKELAIDDNADDDWEEDSAAMLPDDFPILVVNSARFCREVQKEPDEDEISSERQVDKEDEIRFQIQSVIKYHPEEVLESLFDQGICFHAFYGTVKSLKRNLEMIYPGDHFLQVDYPAEVNGIPLHCHLHTLYRVSHWQSVEYLLDSLRSCSRGLKWKAQIASEIEALAQREYAWFQRTQEEQSIAIDKLSRLRDSLNQKIRSLISHEYEPGKNSTRSSRATELESLMRCSDDVEDKLKDLLTQYLREPTLTEGECRNALGLPHKQDFAAVATELNVLDMVVSMILCRLPRGQKSSEKYYQALVDHHLRILHLWKKDFGRLPPKRITSSKVLQREEVDASKKITKADMTSDCTLHDSAEEIVSPNITDKYGCANDNETESDDLNAASIRKLSHPEDSEMVEKLQSLHLLTSKNRRKKSKNKDAEFKPFACMSALGVLRDEKSKPWM